MRLGSKIIVICLWFVLLPILIFLALNKQFYFIDTTEDFIIWSIILLAFFIVFSLAVLFGFKREVDEKNSFYFVTHFIWM